jgi:large subunit ribosomal protein L9
MAYMEVLLREDVENLGDRGQIVRVRRGYGRNFLLPQKLAVEASAANLRQIDAERRVLTKREQRERAAAGEAAKDFDGIQLAFERRVGEEGKLFGSVTSLDIARAVEEQGKTIDRHMIRLKEPIKQIGEFDVPLRLHRDIIVTLKVTVTPEGGAAQAAPTAVAALPGYLAPGDTDRDPALRSTVVDEDDEDDEDEDFES